MLLLMLCYAQAAMLPVVLGPGSWVTRGALDRQTVRRSDGQTDRHSSYAACCCAMPQATATATASCYPQCPVPRNAAMLYIFRRDRHRAQTAQTSAERSWQSRIHSDTHVNRLMWHMIMIMINSMIP